MPSLRSLEGQKKSSNIQRNYEPINVVPKFFKIADKKDVTISRNTNIETEIVNFDVQVGEESDYSEIYNLLGYDEATAQSMQKKMNQYKDFIMDANQVYDLRKEMIDSELNNNIYYNIANGAENGNWFYQGLISFLPFLKEKANDAITFELSGGGTRVTYQDDIVTIESPNRGAIYTYQEGLCTKVTFQNGIQADISYGPNGEAYDINFTANGEAISIFGDYTIEQGQYGGSQMLADQISLYDDPRVLESIKKYFPNSFHNSNSVTEDVQDYLIDLSLTGCGYTAFVDMVFEQFRGKELEFEQTFGFPMYSVDETGNIDFNYEYLIIDLFSYVWSKKVDDINYLYAGENSPFENMLNHPEYRTVDGTITGTVRTNSSYNPYVNTYTTFNQWLFQNYGVAIDRTEHIKTDFYREIPPHTEEWKQAVSEWETLHPSWSYNPDWPFNVRDDETFRSIVEECLQRGPTIIGGDGFDLYALSNLETPTQVNVGSHLMYVTDITSEGMIVSSWGNKYLLKNEDYMNIHSIQNFHN